MLLFLALISSVSSFCTEPPPNQITVSRRLEGPPVEEPLYEGIRAISDFQILVNPTPSSTRIAEFIPRVLEWLGYAIKVRRAATNTLDSTECGGIPVPADWNSPSEYDLFLIVTYSDIGSHEAWAQICEVNPDENMRPILGRIHLQGPDISELTWEQMFGLLAHQIAHVLAFNANLLPYFAGSLGEALGIDNVLGTYYRRNQEVMFIKTPMVLEIAKSSFGCNSIEGVDLENLIETLGSLIHWDKRIMFNDFMTADPYNYYILYSEISFALFEDSGWYQTEWEYSNPIFWGAKAGCEFLLDPCLVNNQPQFEQFCNETTASSYCDPTHSFKGMCNVQTGLTIPFEFQYFDDSTKGGADSYLDFCPVVLPTETGSCRNGGPVNTFDYGEKVCEGCRCLEGTYVSQFSTLTIHHHASCHEITCSGSTAIIHVGDEIAHCTPAGGTVNVRGYDGLLFCPNSDILCKHLHCIDNCNGRGKCVDGECQCEAGYSGTLCESYAGLLGALFVLVFINL